MALDRQRPLRAAGRTRADERRGGAVGEHGGGQHAVDVGGRLQVQRAQLHRHDQHHGPRVGGAEGLRHAQRGEGGEAPHETEVVALDVRGQPQAALQVQVDAGREEAGARDGDQVGHVGRGQLASGRERVARRRLGDRRGVLGVERVALAGRRRAEATVGVEEQRRRRRRAPAARALAALGQEVVEDAVASVDGAGAVDAVEQLVGAPIAADPTPHERPHVGLRVAVRRERRADGVKGDGHVGAYARHGRRHGTRAHGRAG
jgi:hypothetical protein